MTQEQIDNRLGSFEKGSYIVSQDSYNNYIKNKDVLGRYNDGNNYILHNKDMDKLMTESKGDVSFLEEKLGFPNGYFKDDPIYRIDALNPERNNIRITTGKEVGTKEYFNTSLPKELPPEIVFDKTGQKKYREAVVDCLLNDNKNVIHRVYEVKADPLRPEDRLINERNDEAKYLLKNYAHKNKNRLTYNQRKEEALKDYIRHQGPTMGHKKDMSEATHSYTDEYIQNHLDDISNAKTPEMHVPEMMSPFNKLGPSISPLDPIINPKPTYYDELNKKSMNEWKIESKEKIDHNAVNHPDIKIKTLEERIHDMSQMIR